VIAPRYRNGGTREDIIDSKESCLPTDSETRPTTIEECDDESMDDEEISMLNQGKKNIDTDEKTDQGQGLEELSPQKNATVRKACRSPTTVAAGQDDFHNYSSDFSDDWSSSAVDEDEYDELQSDIAQYYSSDSLLPSSEIDEVDEYCKQQSNIPLSAKDVARSDIPHTPTNVRAFYRRDSWRKRNGPRSHEVLSTNISYVNGGLPKKEKNITPPNSIEVRSSKFCGDKVSYDIMVEDESNTFKTVPGLCMGYSISCA